MKVVWIAALCVSMLTIQAFAQKKTTLKTKKDRISYSIGMNIANNLKQQSYDVDPELVAKGIKDMMSGSATLCTEQEAEKSINEYQTELTAKHEAQSKISGEKNMKEGEKFLAENKQKPGIITLPSGLQYKILKTGTGPKPTLAQTVTINYRGTLINGKEFDGSKKDAPLTYPVNQFIKGWTEALQLMAVGSKWQLFVPSDLAYGERGAGGDIGPNATLLFDVELISVK